MWSETNCTGGYSLSGVCLYDFVSRDIVLGDIVTIIVVKGDIVLGDIVWEKVYLGDFMQWMVLFPIMQRNGCTIVSGTSGNH